MDTFGALDFAIAAIQQRARKLQATHSNAEVRRIRRRKVRWPCSPHFETA
jgi:hypothetical protein